MHVYIYIYIYNEYITILDAKWRTSRNHLRRLSKSVHNSWYDRNMVVSSTLTGAHGGRQRKSWKGNAGSREKETEIIKDLILKIASPTRILVGRVY